MTRLQSLKLQYEEMADALHKAGAIGNERMIQKLDVEMFYIAEDIAILEKELKEHERKNGMKFSNMERNLLQIGLLERMSVIHSQQMMLCEELEKGDNKIKLRLLKEEQSENQALLDRLED